LNHRLLLEGIFSICGIKQSDFKTVCSSVDKLDKAPWDDIRKELVDEKGIDEKAADALEYYVRLRGKYENIVEINVKKTINRLKTWLY